MGMREPIKISVCVDCLFITANGETEPNFDYETWESNVLSRWPSDQYEPGLSTGDDEGFSWYSCDYCGSNLGGDRHVGYVFEVSP